MKWLALLVAVASVLPLALWLRRRPSDTYKIFAVIGFLPFFLSLIPGLGIALVSWPTWAGYAHGMEITVIDILAIIVYLGLPRAGRPLPFRLVFGLYFLAVLLSIFQAQVPLAAAFYAWQFARMYLLFAIVARACTDERVVVFLLRGMAVGLWLQAMVVIWQRYRLGIVQTQGTFVHQNTLGIVTHLVVLPHFALLLAGHRGLQPAATSLAGAIIAVLTASRATLGLSALGFAVTYLLSAFKQWTPRKAVLAIGGAVALAALLPLAVASLSQRFAVAPLSEEYDEREAFKRAAAMIVADYPMGIGANHYVYVSKNLGYSERAGVIPQSRNSHVHHAYWLAQAETGYFGLIAFVLLLLRPLTVALAAGWRHRADRRGDLLLGLGAGLLIVYLHSFVEWILFSEQVQYLFAMVVGMVAGLAQQLGYWSRPRPAGAFPSGHRQATAGEADIRQGARQPVRQL